MALVPLLSTHSQLFSHRDTGDIVPTLTCLFPLFVLGFGVFSLLLVLGVWAFFPLFVLGFWFFPLFVLGVCFFFSPLCLGFGF